MGGGAISIQANSSSSKAVGRPSHSSEWRCSLRRLRLADCDYLAESALGSLIGHAEMETLDLSRTTHVLTGASVAALLHLGGEATVLPTRCTSDTSAAKVPACLAHETGGRVQEMAWAPQDLVEHCLWKYCCNATDMQTSLYGSPDPSLQNMVEGLHFSPVLSISHNLGARRASVLSCRWVGS